MKKILDSHLKTFLLEIVVCIAIIVCSGCNKSSGDIHGTLYNTRFAFMNCSESFFYFIVDDNGNIYVPTNIPNNFQDNSNSTSIYFGIKNHLGKIICGSTSNHSKVELSHIELE